ncbi:MAG: histone deacetylase [Phycisphaerae bacterium]
MAAVGLAQDKRLQDHLTGGAHPERPQRLEAIAAALCTHRLTQACASVEVSPIDLELVRRVHADSYITRVESACADGLTYIDVPDSAICPRSYEVALLAAGAVINAVAEVMAGRLDRAFCAVRPPGHHAEHDRSIGFCMFNNVAIAAQYLLDQHHMERVLIVDWDVHHGNGTQHTFDADPRVLFISLHGHPGIVYPGTGYADERGKGGGIGTTINLPMIPPAGDGGYRAAFDDTVLPAVLRFAPQFVLVSAGFDAHRLDPLAPLELETTTFGWMTDELVAVAKRHCGGRLVSVLEGGYHLGALGECTSLHVARMLEA